MSAALPIMLRAATRPEDENNNFFVISPGPGGTARLSHTHRAREPSASGGCSPFCCYEEERGKSPHHPLRRPHQHSSASSGRTFKRRNEWRKQPDQSSCCFTTHLVDGDEAFGVRVDAALLQETCCWDTSCSTETGIIPTGHIWAIRNYIIYCIFLLENKCVQVCATRKRGVLWRSFLMSPAPMTQTSARRTLPLFSTTSFSCGKRTRCVGALFYVDESEDLSLS